MANKLLVAYDGSDASKKALNRAHQLATTNPNAQLLLVHSLRLPDPEISSASLMNTLMDRADGILAELEEFASDLPNETEIRLLKGSSTADMIIHCAKEEGCNLIVMGSRGRGGFKGYLGSVSLAVVQGAEADVLVCK